MVTLSLRAGIDRVSFVAIGKKMFPQYFPTDGTHTKAINQPKIEAVFQAIKNKKPDDTLQVLYYIKKRV